MKENFEFEDNGRRFACAAERLSRTNPETWWWFSVSVEANARYAPFRTSKSDTPSSVQANVVGFYDALLAKRAEPPVSRWQRGIQRSPDVKPRVVDGDQRSADSAPSVAEAPRAAGP